MECAALMKTHATGHTTTRDRLLQHIVFLRRFYAYRLRYARFNRTTIFRNACFMVNGTTLHVIEAYYE